MKPYLIRGMARKDGVGIVVNYAVEDFQFLAGEQDRAAKVLFNRMCERDGYEEPEYVEVEAI